MLRDTALAAGETYHVYNRGAHKQAIFTSDSDYTRFSLLLYLSNAKESVHLSNLLPKYQGRSSVEMFQSETSEKSLVDVLAYCLMPNHFHLVLQQKTDDGITKFMRKVATGYSMYFNTKYEHSGVLFQGRFKSSHIDSEAYHRYIFSYVHLNPIGLVEPAWEERGIRAPEKVRKFLRGYPHSSFYDYSVGKRPEMAILALDKAPDFLKEQDDLEEMLKDFRKNRLLHN